jgi:hypothetical protein
VIQVHTELEFPMPADTNGIVSVSSFNAVQDMLLNTDYGDRAEPALRKLSPRAQDRVRNLADIALKADGFRKARAEETARQKERRNDLLNRKMHTLREIERSGVKPMKNASDPERGGVAHVAVDLVQMFDVPLAEIKARLNELTAMKIPSSPLSDVFDFLGENSSRSFVDADVPLPALRKGETPAEYLDRMRGEVDRLQLDLHYTERRPRTAAIMKATVKRDLDRIAKDGAPRLGSIRAGGYIDRRGVFRPENQPGARLRFPQVRTGVVSKGDEDPTIDNALPFLVWLMHAEIEEKIFALIDAQDTGDGLTVEEKRRLIADIKVRIREAEHAEESAVLLCEANGIAVERRPTNPMVLLVARFNQFERIW